MVVKPAMSVARRWFVARATRSASPSCDTWSVQDVSLYAWSRMCECPSTSPGVSVVPGKSITFAPAAATLASVPTASMRSPFTRTAHPSCTSTPSKTRAGFKTVTASFGSGRGRGCAVTRNGTLAAITAASTNRLGCMRRIIVKSAC